ncbi:hypothetical protein CPB83DRAFT_513036 [Crepidotus variabilis]|uniref:Uncharacterized protein n=1 Tax=Crepidotus variabilis TaxID=179855 RepID=A0A9P6JMQ2_9AGAR|nr:hypothetical protein CPB83DRAFT_513036 [Crepidotus variabilis]
MTGKACVHILAAKLHRDYGSVEDYKELETIQKDHGPEVKDQIRNPTKAVTGRRHQARADSAVMEDLESFYSNVVDSNEENSKKTKTVFQKPQLKSKETEKIVVGSTSGRPAKTAPLHPARTSVKFSNKPGPKPKPHNSLLPPLTPKKPSVQKPINFLPKKAYPEAFSPKKEKHLKIGDNVSEQEEHHMEVLSFGHWKSPNYWMQQDEMQIMVDLLNAISVKLSSGVLVVPDTYAFSASVMEELDWTKTDHPPRDLTGKVFFVHQHLIYCTAYRFIFFRLLLSMIV